MMKSANRKSWIRTRCVIVIAMLPLAVTVASAQQSKPLPAGVVASQGGAQVTLQDIDAFAQKIPEGSRRILRQSQADPEVSSWACLLAAQQLAEKARAEKLDRDPLVKLQIQQAIDDTLARVSIEHYRKSLKLPDSSELAQEYYLSHKDEYILHGAVDVKHVLVSTKDRSEGEAKARIGEVSAQAHAHPDQFDALMEKYSDDPAKHDNHGLIEDAASGKTVVPFARAAAALKKPGDLSPAIKTEYGYHVLKLVERKPDTQKAFSEVRESLIAKLSKDYIDKTGCRLY